MAKEFWTPLCLDGLLMEYLQYVIVVESYNCQVYYLLEY